MAPHARAQAANAEAIPAAHVAMLAADPARPEAYAHASGALHEQGNQPPQAAVIVRIGPIQQLLHACFWGRPLASVASVAFAASPCSRTLRPAAACHVEPRLPGRLSCFL
eukprot:5532710-Pyramimonas_sp.AAC.1